jgi:hypothetical protein
MGAMKTVWKVLLGLALVVPMGAYVVGSLAASASDDPAPRHSIRIEQHDPTPSGQSTPTPGQDPSGEPSADSSGHGRSGDDDEVEVITPEYDDFDDEDDGHDDDHSGSGGQDDGRHDDNSGHGGGDD